MDEPQRHYAKQNKRNELKRMNLAQYHKEKTNTMWFHLNEVFKGLKIIETEKG